MINIYPNDCKIFSKCFVVICDYYRVIYFANFFVILYISNEILLLSFNFWLVKTETSHFECSIRS